MNELRKTLANLCVIQAVFILGLFAVNLYYGPKIALDVLFRQHWQIGLHMVVGVLLSVAVFSVLHSQMYLSEDRRRLIFILLALFTAYVAISGYITVLLSVIVAFFAFKFWRSENA